MHENASFVLWNSYEKNVQLSPSFLTNKHDVSFDVIQTVCRQFVQLQYLSLQSAARK